MRTLLVAAALAPACLLLTAAAPMQDVLDQLTDKATELFGEKGLTPTGWVSNGTLAQGATKTVSVTLKDGVSSIVGMCDTDCGDLNLVIKDSKGNELDSDLEDDDFPILVTDKGGTASVTVTMVACKTSACRYRLVGFKK
jgi:hypothetical protein